MSDHLCRTAPEVYHVSDRYISQDSPQDLSVCVSLNLWLFDEAPGEFHSKSSDTPGTSSGLSSLYHHICHRVSQIYSVWVLCWSRGRGFHWMFLYRMDICRSDCCPSTGSGSSYRCCVHMECWLDQWTNPDRSNTGAPLIELKRKMRKHLLSSTFKMYAYINRNIKKNTLSYKQFSYGVSSKKEWSLKWLFFLKFISVTGLLEVYPDLFSRPYFVFVVSVKPLLFPSLSLFWKKFQHTTHFSFCGWNKTRVMPQN